MIACLDKIYRAVFCHGGHGVHSPFVFDLITTVIEEHNDYYCYEQLQTIHMQVLHRKDERVYGTRKRPIKKTYKKYGLTSSELKLLFRLANRIQPKTMLVVGSNFGLTPLYLTAYSSDFSCVVIEPDPVTAMIANEYINKYATASIEVLPCLDDIPENLDFIFWDIRPFNNNLLIQTFERFMLHVHEMSVLVIAGINMSSNCRKTWKTICTHPQVTVTIDLCHLGIVYFNPKLHRNTYKTFL